MRISERYLKKLFRDNWGLYYGTFELNEKLYLHYKGFKKIENLHLFPDLNCIYLEGNGFTKMEGFEGNLKLRALYIHENVFDKIENVNHLKELHYLNLNDNYIGKIENLEDMPTLSTLQIKKNNVGKNGLDDVRGLLEIPTLSVLDISENSIDDTDIVDEILVNMPNLRVLYLKGNPVCKKIKFYKKTLISKIKTLRYLDDAPVFPEDRRYAEAWAEGGLDKEREERKIVKKEKDDAHWKNHEAFRDMIRKAKESKIAAEAEKVANENISDSKENVAPAEEPAAKVEELKADGNESEEVIDTSKVGVSKQNQDDQAYMDALKQQDPNAASDQVKSPDSEDLPPELEEVSDAQIQAEHLKTKTQAEAMVQPPAEQLESQSDRSSVVDVNDIQIANSNSIKVSSVTSETSEVNRSHHEEAQPDDAGSQNTEEEKHLEDSASEPDEESAKTEPNEVQAKLNEAESPYKHNGPATKLHDDDGEYLDELD